MSKVSYETCDRCGAAIDRAYQGILTVKRRLWVKLFSRIGYGPYDYMEVDYDLCEDCEKELQTWLRREEATHDDE